jgi:hypothetical protein
MEDLLCVTGGDGITHLTEHGRDKTETSAGEQLGRMQVGKQTRSGGCMRGRDGGLGGVDVIMVTGLFQKVKEILARDVFEKEEQKGRGLKGAMKSDNVGMQMQ